MLGNLAVNIWVVLISVLTIFFYRKNFFNTTYSLPDKILSFLFIYIFCVMIINLLEIKFLNKFNQINNDETIQYIIYKSIAYSRYLIFYLSIKFLIKNDIINFKLFFIICFILTLFVSFDLFFQLTFNKDIFGLVPLHPRKLSGPFGQELIAGAFLQRFFLFFCPLIMIFYFYKKKHFLIIFFITIILSAILISGNRMPLLLSVLMLLIYFFYEKNIRKYLLVGFSIFLIFFSIAINKNEEIRDNFGSLKKAVTNMSINLFVQKIDRTQLPPHYFEFESFYNTWQINKFFGGSVRSFRIFCPIKKNTIENERTTCNTHPHNYYLEIMTDLGLFGLIIISIFVSLILKNSYFYISKIKPKTKIFYLFLPFFIVFIAEVFPLKTSGSFFSTWNSSFIFLIFACLNGLYEKNKTK